MTDGSLCHGSPVQLHRRGEVMSRSNAPRLPLAIFAVPLGLLALANAWRAAAGVWPSVAPVAELLFGASALVWLGVAIGFVRSALRDRGAAWRDFRDPLQGSFAGILPVTILLLGIGAAPHDVAIARCVVGLGIALAASVALHQVGLLWQGGRNLESVLPSVYVAAGAGGFVSASAASTIGQPGVAQLAFGVGLLSWLALDALVVVRLYGGAPLGPAQRPTLGLQFAPPAIGAVAYLNVGSGAPDLVAHALLGYALLQAALFVRNVRWIAAGGVGLGFWSVSFGVAALPTAALRLVSHGDAGAVTALAAPLFALGNLVIAGLVVRTTFLAARGRLIPAAPPIAVGT